MSTQKKIAIYYCKIERNFFLVLKVIEYMNTEKLQNCQLFYINLINFYVISLINPYLILFFVKQ